MTTSVDGRGRAPRLAPRPDAAPKAVKTTDTAFTSNARRHRITARLIGAGPDGSPTYHPDDPMTDRPVGATPDQHPHFKIHYGPQIYSKLARWIEVERGQRSGQVEGAG
ncbi:MAG TPA: hypothetical protein VIU87_13395 [Mycobacterium sp.]